MNLHKLGFDQKLEKKKSLLLPTTVTGAAIMPYIASHNAKAGLAGLNQWDESLHAARNIAATRPFTINEAQNVFDSYIKGGKQLANTRVMGVRAGKFMQYGTKAGKKFLEHVGGDPQAIARKKGGIHHYELYSNKNSTLEELRTHHIIKGLEAEYHNEYHNPAIFTEDVHKVLHTPTDSLAQKIEDIKKISPAASDIVRQAIVGSADTMGEAKRLAGDTKGIISTPELYKATALGPISNILEGSRYAKIIGTPIAAAIVGRRVYKDLKKHAAATSVYKKDRKSQKNLALTAGTLSTAVATTVLGVRHLLQPAKHIGVTYGIMPEVGFGHAMPAKAIAQSLQQDPRFKNRQIDLLERDQYGIFRGTGKKYNTIVNTGLGAYTPDPSVKLFNPTRFTHGHDLPTNLSRRNQINYLTDMVDSEGHTLGATFNYHKPRGTKMLTYGPHAQDIMKRKKVQTLHATEGISPALFPDKIEAASTSPRSQNEVLNDLIADVKNQAVPKSEDSLHTRKDTAEQIRKLRNLKNKKIITISGSRRGDYVTSRAYELDQALKAHGLDKTHGILAILGDSAKESSATLLKNTEVGHVGLVPSKLYNEAQAIAHINWGSTGASSFSEALTQKNIQALPSRWGYNMYNKENPIDVNSIAGRQEQLFHKHNLQGHHSNIDTWNRGNIEYAQKQKGVVTANSPEDIISVLKDSDKIKKLQTESVERATTIKNDYYKGRSTMNDLLWKSVKETEGKERLLGAGLVAAGIGIGAYGLHRVFSNHKKIHTAIKTQFQ